MVQKSTKKRTASKTTPNKKCCSWNGAGDTCGGCAYFLGFLGAAIYYISTATGFWNGVLGFLKAIIWPLFLVLDVLKYIGA